MPLPYPRTFLRCCAGGVAAAGPADARVQSLLDSFFGSDDALPEGDRFLKNYILKKVR